MPRIPSITRRNLWIASALLATMLLAAGLRLRGLADSPLAYDECFSWRLAQSSATDIVQRTAIDVHPPLSYLLLKAWFSVFGSSVYTLRTFSACWGILAIPIVYAIVREGVRLAPHAGQSSSVRQAALLAALLFALHPSEVHAARLGRMYSLGVFLAASSTWLLLRALRARRGAVLWWTAYGLAVAAFCYTHNYALFSVLAQGMFFLATWLGRPGHASLGWFAYAAVLAFVLFAPWLPVLVQQSRAVQAGFWIPELDAREVGRWFLAWGAGRQSGAAIEIIAWITLFGLLMTWVVARGDRAGRFFVLQALAPWALALSGSLLLGRSILVERYLLFSHPFLTALWGWCWLRLAKPGRWIVIGLLVATAMGLLHEIDPGPTPGPALEQAAGFVCSHLEPGDVILADNAMTANCLHCYLGSVEGVAVRAVHSAARRDVHMSHAAALGADDVIDPAALGSLRADRLWLVNGHAASLPAGLARVMEQSFAGPDGASYTVALYARTTRP